MIKIRIGRAFAAASLCFAAFPAVAQIAYYNGVSSMGTYAWVDGPSAVRQPNGLASAVAGGTSQKQTLYLCRARHPNPNETHPGKLLAGKCNFGYGGAEIVAQANFEVLVRTAPAQSEQWQAPSAQNAQTAFVAGRAGQNQYLRVCRAAYQNETHPGKEWAGKCNIGWGGKEVVVDRFEVLVLSGSAAAPKAAPQDFAAAITKQINSIDPKTDKVSSLIELVTVTKLPLKLAAQSLSTPPGFTVVSLKETGQPCAGAAGADCKQRFQAVLEPGKNCTLNGGYRLNLATACAAGANCGAPTRQVPFSLTSENFCSSKTVDVPKKN